MMLVGQGHMTSEASLGVPRFLMSVWCFFTTECSLKICFPFLRHGLTVSSRQHSVSALPLSPEPLCLAADVSLRVHYVVRADCCDFIQYCTFCFTCQACMCGCCTHENIQLYHSLGRLFTRNSKTIRVVFLVCSIKNSKFMAIKIKITLKLF